MTTEQRCSIYKMVSENSPFHMGVNEASRIIIFSREEE